ncbi:hypothetical protein [Granulicella paludicola]|uniref:hypothetical protein n=1 Tax=Granulicella paludicola TaxID=474951 RepID=UPI0021E024D3|nr:hypothetical protein [Granulicella paludicola]
MKHITAPRIFTTLVTASFFSFFPLFIWKNSQPLLAFAGGLSFITFCFIGAACLFGSRETVINIAWGKRRNVSDTSAVLFGRFMGALFLAFMIYVACDIFRNNGTSIYTNLGR